MQLTNYYKNAIIKPVLAMEGIIFKRGVLVKGKFEFRAVGQGLFYTGIFNDRSCFIYDCGSSNSQNHLYEQIDNFESEFKGDVDFLVVSHMHNDHISGLPKLIEEYKVNKIYLPYLGIKNGNLTHLIIAYASINSRGGFDASLYNSMVKIYQDKQSTFIEQESNKPQSNKPPESKYVYLRESIPEPSLLQSSVPVWKFVLFNKRLNDKRLKELETLVQQQLDKSKCDNIDELIKSEDGIKNVKKIYKEIVKQSQNISSMILVHYPLMPALAKIYNNPCNKCCFHCNKCCFLYRNKKHAICDFATVLTGDAEFDDSMNKELQKVLNSHEGWVLQVPHHGSYRNWVSLDSHRENFEHYIIPCGKNNYRLPSIDVVSNILMQGKRLSLVTENVNFKYAIQMNVQ